MSKRPTFFLSSTIFDFKDLRSAIKYTLESRGCQVLASEFNDFPVDSQSHSYEACLTNISMADYFILLIGNRVGGWYDEKKHVSITQQEYREAYRRHLAGQLRIVTLVRAEVWQAKEERKELGKLLSELDLTKPNRETIKNFPSKFMDNADFIIKFLDEVSHNQETANAVKCGGVKPSGNWIYPFTTFREVDDVLQPLTFTGRTADEAAYRKALQHELMELMQRLLLKYNEKVIDPRSIISDFRNHYPITKKALETEVCVQGNDWKRFSIFMFRLLGCRIKPIVINDALTSPIFMDYNPQTSSYVQSSAYDLLSRLVNEISLFTAAVNSETLSLFIKFSPSHIGNGPNYSIPGQPLALAVGLSMRWYNILSICIALIQHLEGQKLQKPRLMPYSPIVGMQDEIDKETVTVDEIKEFLKL